MMNQTDTPLIKLRVDFLSQGTQFRHAYILFLRECDGERLLPLLIDEKGARVLQKALQERDFPTTDVATGILHACNIQLQGVLLHMQKDGSYKGMLALSHPTQGHLYTEVSAINALCMALQHRADILMSREVFDARYSQQGLNGQMAFPISSMSYELLEEALKMAVENDEFELAAQLQREIDSKKKEKEE